ncbi:MAG: hypothetical protein KJ065_26830 [Anaerolineae bacterium]|nr:hypothetical protein [Anaerolineae bacterium]
MRREIEIDDALPKPGEPLTPKIHEHNQAILDEELQERQRRLNGRLGWRERLRLKKRYRQLWRKLRAARWNDLVNERWQLHQQYIALKHSYSQPGQHGNHLNKLKRDARAVAARGRQLNALIERWQPLADEFEQISGKLKTHHEIIAYEAEERENHKAFRREAITWEAQIKSVFRQSKRLHHAGYDAKGEWFCDIPIIERCIFREDRVLYLLKISKRTWLRKWKSALPYNVDVDDLMCEETLENLKAHTNRVVEVVRSQNGQNIFYAINRVDSPDGIPKKVLYSKVMPWYPTKDHTKTPWCAGVTNDRKTEWFNFEDEPHVLIAGSTKSGKSNQINAMITTMTTMNSPAELRLVLIDNKGGVEFTHWSALKHLATPMIKSAERVLPTLRWLRQIMERRLAAFEAIKAKNLMSYNAKVDDTSKLPRVVVVIDEMATLLGLGDLTTDIQNELRVLTSQGRAVGLHVIVCTQHSSADVLPGWIKTNMVLRIAGKMPSHHASMTILDSASAAMLPDNVGRMVFALGRYEVIAQTPFISDEEIARAVHISREFPEPDNREFAPPESITAAIPALFQPVERFSQQDLIAAALEHFEGQLSANKLYEVIDPELITLHALRKMIAGLINGHQFKYHGVVYGIEKRKRSYYVVPAGTVQKDDEVTEPDIDNASEMASQSESDDSETRENKLDDTIDTAEELHEDRDQRSVLVV